MSVPGTTKSNDNSPFVSVVGFGEGVTSMKPTSREVTVVYLLKPEPETVTVLPAPPASALRVTLADGTEWLCVLRLSAA